MYKPDNYFEASRIMRIFVLVTMLVVLFATLAFADPSDEASKSGAQKGSVSQTEMILRSADSINGEDASMREAADTVVKKGA